MPFASYNPCCDVIGSSRNAISYASDRIAGHVYLTWSSRAGNRGNGVVRSTSFRRFPLVTVGQSRPGSGAFRLEGLGSGAFMCIDACKASFVCPADIQGRDRSHTANLSNFSTMCRQRRRKLSYQRRAFPGALRLLVRAPSQCQRRHAMQSCIL